MERDKLVLSECRARRVPVVTVMSGGYAENITQRRKEEGASYLRTFASLREA
jgi:hypothetical protein